MERIKNSIAVGWSASRIRLLSVPAAVNSGVRVSLCVCRSILLLCDCATSGRNDTHFTVQLGVPPFRVAMFC